MSEAIRTAFVFGAGRGERLRPLTNTCPKPLLSVHGRPLITYVFDHLIAHGIKRLIVNTHHLAEKYLEIFPSREWQGVPIIFNHEPVLLDTAGGLKNIEDLIQEDPHILVYNGDIFTTLPLRPLLDYHLASDNDVSLILRSTGHPLNVSTDEKGLIRDLRGTLGVTSANHRLFTGIYAVNRKFFAKMHKDRIESIVEVWLRMLSQGEHTIGSVTIDDGMWCDIGTPAEYERQNANSSH